MTIDKNTNEESSSPEKVEKVEEKVEEVKPERTSFGQSLENLNKALAINSIFLVVGNLAYFLFHERIDLEGSFWGQVFWGAVVFSPFFWTACCVFIFPSILLSFGYFSFRDDTKGFSWAMVSLVAYGLLFLTGLFYMISSQPFL